MFVNIDNEITKHNLLETKGFTSAAMADIEKYENGTMDYLPFIPNKNFNGASSKFQLNVTSEYRTEYNCEIFRKQYFPLYPSRLSAIYTFGDYESCEKASKLYGDSGGSCDFWNLVNVRKFKLLPFPMTRVAKVNMEIVSLARGADGILTLSQESNYQIWNAYWSCQDNISIERLSIEREVCHSGLIWEYLIEGRIELAE